MESDIAILMADLAGYTAMTDVHGGESAANIVKKYMQMVDAALAGTAKVYQRIGDQVVIISQNADDILASAHNLINMSEDEHHFLSVHAGIHYGRVFIENDGLFGSTINIASRIMNMATRGQVLCSQDFVNQFGDKTAFVPYGSHQLKNILEKFTLFQLVRTADPAFLIDPVCHMQIDPSKTPYSLTIDDRIYYFCSDHCRTLFKNAPATFINMAK